MTRRENWKGRGYVLVTRQSGRLVTWKYWSSSPEFRAALSSTSPKKPLIPKDYIVFSKTDFSNGRKRVTTSRPMAGRGKLAQLKLVFLAKKGRRSLICEGYSNVHDPSRESRRMVREATDHAYAQCTFSPDEFVLLKQRTRFIYVMGKIK